MGRARQIAVFLRKSGSSKSSAHTQSLGLKAEGRWFKCRTTRPGPSVRVPSHLRPSVFSKQSTSRSRWHGTRHGTDFCIY